MRIVNKITYRKPTNPVFIKLKALKFKDLGDFKTQIQIMYRTKTQLLTNKIRKLFQMWENKHNLRGIYMFMNS